LRTFADIEAEKQREQEEQKKLNSTSKPLLDALSQLMIAAQQVCIDKYFPLFVTQKRVVLGLLFDGINDCWSCIRLVTWLYILVLLHRW